MGRGAVGRWLPVAIMAVAGGQTFAFIAVERGQPAVMLGWLASLALAVRWPIVAAFAAGIALRTATLGQCCTDQIIVSQSAFARAADGLSPYGVGYASTIPPGAPFPYGPLGLVWWLPGPVAEFAATLAIMGVLAYVRAYPTLMLFAVWWPSVLLQWVGVNDYSPGLLILVGWLVMRRHVIGGAGILAASAALKPYAFAWFLPAIGFGGLASALTLAGISAVLWAPLLWWGGPAAYLESVRLAGAVHAFQRDALNLPTLRWLAIPIMAAGLFTRRWEWCVLLGSAAFAVFLFLDVWASHSYWLALLPVTGVAIESLMARAGSPAGSWSPTPARRRSSGPGRSPAGS